MTKTHTFAAAFSAIVLLSATSASALTVSTAVVGDASSSMAKTGVNVNVGVSGSNTSENGTSSGSTNASGAANVKIAVPLVVTQADVTNGTVQASAVSVGSVQSQQDLSGYIAAKMHSDAHLSAVDTASDHVAVTYPEPAELFGFVPVTVETTATTDASGNVSVTQPWWSFLAATDNATLQSNVQTSVRSVLGLPAQAGASASSNTQLTVSQQAQLVAAIQSAMSAALSASASANVRSQ